MKAAWAIFGTMVLGACGSTTSEPAASCGPGTELRDGVCVIADAGSSDDVFVDAGSPTDTTAPATDTSTFIDTSSSTDTTGLPDGVAPTDTTPPPTDSSTVDTGVDATDTSVPETSTSSGDPCPSKVIDVNCSTTCGGPTTNCSDARCTAGRDPFTTLIGSYSKFPYIIRTPDKPGMDAVCNSLGCEPGKSVAYGVGLRIDLPYYKKGLRITVGSPWRVRQVSHSGWSPYCAREASFGSGCIYLDTSFVDLMIDTDDPNAPSRNILIEDPSVRGCP